MGGGRRQVYLEGQRIFFDFYRIVLHKGGWGLRGRFATFRWIDRSAPTGFFENVAHNRYGAKYVGVLRAHSILSFPLTYHFIPRRSVYWTHVTTSLNEWTDLTSLRLRGFTAASGVDMGLGHECTRSWGATRRIIEGIGELNPPCITLMYKCSKNSPGVSKSLTTEVAFGARLVYHHMPLE
jgi:hypothetical protein